MTLEAQQLPALTTRVDLAGRVAIVTGAGRGIGRGIAEGLAAAGAAVVAADLDAGSAAATAERLGAQGATSSAVEVDVTDSTSVAAMVEQSLADHARVDILVNNAAIATTKITEETTEADWRKVIDVNLTGPFLCSNAVLAHMTDRGSGRIVNIASVAAKRISFNAGASYTASKAGLLALTRHLAYEVAGRGVTVNAVCPGPTLTPMMAEVATEETLRAREKSVPRGRLALPEDIMRGVLFLVSDLAEMVCGQALDVDGGALLGWYDTETYFERRGAAIARG
jgi:NAD(P)-dependent dehydrogenase (short-subunit alcohol dehydrogenase family)